ncbi:MAG: hypothetical protein HQL54_07585 [Magnetococcales bacterium]|nr:hypothetical protein [Magnetococcales bacterium]
MPAEAAEAASEREKIIEFLAEIKASQKSTNKRIDDLKTSIDKRIDDLKTSIDKRFDDQNRYINQRFDDQNKYIDGRFAQVDQRFAQVDQRFAQMDQRFAQVDQRFVQMDQRITELYGFTNTRLDDLSNMINGFRQDMLAIFGGIFTLIVTLFGYIAWDRRSMVKPIQDRLDSVERKLDQDLDVNNAEGSIPRRLMNVLRELAKTDEKLANVLRSFSLL